MQIRQINPNEYQLVTHLFDQYRVFYKQASDIALAKSFIKNRLENNESVIFVAMDGDTPVGFTQLYPLLSSVRATKNWLLNDPYVDNDHRKKGIGRLYYKRLMILRKVMELLLSSWKPRLIIIPLKVYMKLLVL